MLKATENDEFGVKLYPHDMATEVWPLNLSNWTIGCDFTVCKVCPHLVALFSGDHFATFNSLMLIEEVHFEKKMVW